MFGYDGMRKSPIVQGSRSHRRRPRPPKVHADREEGEFSASEIPEQLKELLLQSEEAAVPQGKGKAGDHMDFSVDKELHAEGTRAWKAKLGYEYRNAVVKVLSQIVEFDWRQPFKRSEMAQAVGSGFFVSDGGSEGGCLIVTNAHVVEEARKIWITLPAEGETRYDAEVVGICFDADMALLRAPEAPSSKFFELGDSNQVQYGQEVLTLGYPLGMESIKLTEGIISGRQESFFQTDAPLNPGNSGGPMINSDGKVIGINVAIAQMSQNVGFSIPIFQLQMLFDNMRNRPVDKRVVHKPILGADFSNGTDALHEFLGVTNEKKLTGVYVKTCYEKFPLHNAGVRVGDVLLKFNGHELDNFGQAHVPWSPYAKVSLESLMTLLVHDSKVPIEFSRNGTITESTVTFEDPDNKGYPLLPIIRDYHPPYEEIDFEVIAGMVVMGLNVNIIELLHEEEPTEAVLRFLTPIAASFEGRMKPSVVISSILLGSSLDKSQILSSGTVIQSVNDIEVKTLDDFRKALMKPKEKNEKLYVTIKSASQELAVLPLQDIFREEFELSEMYMYQLSPMMLKSLAANKEMLTYACKGDKKMIQRFRSELNALNRVEEEVAEE